MTDRLARRLAWALWLLTLAISLVTAALIATSFGADIPDNWGFRGAPALGGMAFATAGALIASRTRRNAVGWLLCGGGVSGALMGLGQEYATAAMFIRPGSLPGGELVAWIGGWFWVINQGFFFYALVLFPDGRLPSARWRPFMFVPAAAMALGTFVFALRPGPLEFFSGLANPFAATGTLEVVRSKVELLAPLLFLPAIAWAGYAPLSRYRGSGAVERQQLKWLALAGVVCAVALIAYILSPVIVGRSPLSPPLPSGTPALIKASQSIVAVTFLAIPVAIGFAIMRYRLYDIDVVINRALVYGTTTAGIALAFFAGIVILQTILRPFTNGSEIAVAVSTLVSVALVQPLRRRVRDAVDRRFYRSRYDAARTLDAFSVRLRDEVDLDAVRADLVAAVRETVQPTHASLWLRTR